MTTDNAADGPNEIVERKLLAKVTRRLIPYLFVLYVIAYLDRVNVGFAAIEMKRQLAFSDTVYGTGAGIFFLAYALFEVPSNLILQRVGPRRWIARIMVTWGFASSAMVFVHSAHSFYLLRFLLGFSEAGFFPGIILYLTYWFPARAQARAVASFMTATAIAGVIGGPISGAVLKLDGAAGLAGWKWLFLVEGVPAILLGISVLFLLVDSPDKAKWLKPAERLWLANRLKKDRAENGQESGHRFSDAILNPAVWLLALIYFIISVSLYTISLWLPLILKSFSRGSDIGVAIASSVPYLGAAIGMVLIARSSDRSGDRRWHLSGCLVLAALGYLGCVYARHLGAALAALSLAAVGTWGCFGPFWALPTKLLDGVAVAAGIAIVNSVGALGGFTGPYLTGRFRDATHSFREGLVATCVLLIVGSVLSLCVDLRGRRASLLYRGDST